MAKLEMKKISLIGMRRDRGAMMELLQRMGCLQVADVAVDDEHQRYEPVADEKALDSTRQRLELLQEGIARLDALLPEKKGFLAQPPVLDAAALSALAEKRESVLEACEKIRALDTDTAACNAQIARLQAQKAALMPLEDFDAALGDIKDSKNVRMGLYTVENRRTQAFEEELAGETLLTFQLVGRAADQRIYLVAWHRSLEEADEKLRAYDAKRFIPQESGKPADEIRQYQHKIDELTKQIEQNAEATKAFAPLRDDMKALFDVIGNELTRDEAAEHFIGTKASFMLVGWIEARRMDELKKALSERFGAVYIEELTPGDDEVIPVSLDNPAAVKPYEFVTNMFSAPGRHDIDPNTAMMPFFLAFFGMMVSDAGYGILLSLLALVGLKVFKLKGGMGSIAKILLVGGGLTLFWGALFGTWFGFDAADIGFPRWINPLQETIKMMVLCFALGGIQLLTGMLLDGIQKIKAGQFLDALGKDFSWYFVFGGIALAMFEITKIIGFVCLGIGVFCILFFSNNEVGWNIIKRLSSGLGALYGITGFVSDLLSYMRLFAMGLATGVIGSVINTIVGMIWGGVFGCIMGSLVFVGGHIFNLAINALGAYVHASRLQYIEYYGKFYEGGGEEFSPLARRGKYVHLAD